MEILISNTSENPIYEQIAIQIKQKIISGILVEGDELPSMRHLAKELRISVITTKRAYEELTKEGFIQSIPGKGCYVAKKNIFLERENQLKTIESLFLQTTEIAQGIDISLEELKEILTIIYEGE